MPAPDFERLFVPGTRHELSGIGTVTIRLRTGTELSLPSGKDEEEPEPPALHFALGDFAQGHEMRIGQTLRRQSLTSPSGRYTWSRP
jgi:hypothetical protein